VCSQIKGDPITAHAEIIIVSARTESDFIKNSLDAGATAYVTKPFQPLDLIRRVREALAADEVPTDEALADEVPASEEVVV
jgi:twitching motility two-component system response regulator PilH